VAKDAFAGVIGAIRSALEPKLSSRPDHNPTTLDQRVIAVGRSTQLVAQFAYELERVNGHFIGNITPAELGKNIASIVKRIKPRSIAIGEPQTLQFGPVLNALERSGIELVRFHNANNRERPGLRQQLAHCDLAVVEAQYAIAASGTLVVVASPGQPSSLTLLPPTNVILVEASRILPDMAAAIAALGPSTIRQHRVAFITGPSRTADIEKMIVLGVHGPRELYAAAVWGSGEASGAQSD